MPGHTMMVAFTLGLQPGLFAMELKRTPPVSFEALLERAAREADMEAAHPEFARRLARWAVEEEKPRGGRAQEERRVEPRQREQQPQQHRWGVRSRTTDWVGGRSGRIKGASQVAAASQAGQVAAAGQATAAGLTTVQAAADTRPPHHRRRFARRPTVVGSPRRPIWWVTTH
ncbi:hypothetical protein KSP39_PZI003812 [Platanthera zijinensis]|uniref:Uncharacterized protein n=1 Tax=Platanthera zijinensis TaxID=2320716 RepID=A0AAP0BUZ5_9ASPA